MLFFFIFSAVSLERFTNETQNLLKYGHMIREMQYLDGDNAFRQYNEQFTTSKETVPWQIPVKELRLKVATSKFYPAKLQQNQPFRPRMCYQYDKGKRCNTCAFNAKQISLKPNLQTSQKPVSPNLPTPVLSAKLHDLLLGYESQTLDYLITGFSLGFHLDCVGIPFFTLSKNHKSTDQFPWVIYDCISEGKLQNKFELPVLSVLYPLNI